MPVEVDIAGRMAPPLRDIARQAEEVAKFGTGLWWPDHLIGWFPRGLWHERYGADMAGSHPDDLADPFIAAAAAALGGTPRRVGLVVTDPVRRHPASLLQSAATVAADTGEFVLGLGAGAAANLEPFGFDTARRFRRLADAVEVVNALKATDDLVQHDSTSYELDDAVSGIPGRRAVRVWIGGVTERYARLAGSNADGFVPTRMPADTYGDLVALMRETADAAGRAQPVASMFVWALVCESGEEARSLLNDALFVRSLLFFRGSDYYESRGLPHPLYGISPDLKYLPATLSTEQAELAASRVPSDALDEYVLHGSVAEVEATLGELERHGLQHIILFDLAPWIRGAREASRLSDLLERRAASHETKAAPRPERVEHGRP
jgi:phthiodiolone/phenolphthiodiolone dimycocerosates ketoreductase